MDVALLFFDLILQLPTAPLTAVLVQLDENIYSPKHFLLQQIAGFFPILHGGSTHARARSF